MREDEYQKMYFAENNYFWFVAKQELVKKLISTLNLKENAEILDIGCGTGINLENTKQFKFSIGLDHSRDALSFCTKRDLKLLVQAEATKLPFRENSFDLVLALDILEHLEDDRLCLDEIHRILKPSCFLLFTVPAYQIFFGAHDFAMGHKRRYSKALLIKRLGEANLKPLFIRNHQGILFPFSVALKIYQKRFGSRERTIPYELPSPINKLFLGFARIEIKLWDKINLPFGTTLVGLATKAK